MKVALGGIFEISSGGTPSKTHAEYYDGNIPWVKTGDLKSEYLNSVDEYITDEGLKNSSAKMYEPGTVLLAMYGATIGAASILTFNACTNQACAAFKPCKYVIPEYLYYFLLSRREKFIHDGVGGAQPNISGRYLKQVEFELYPINEQRFVISVLDRVNRIISLKKEEIKKLDELIKARFIEMFGSVKTELLLEDISEFITVGIANSATHAYSDSGVPLLRNQNIKENFLDDTDLKYITPEFAKLYESKKLKENDIIAMRTGYPGVCCLVPKKYEGCQTFTTLIIRLKPNNNPVYICNFINSDFAKAFIDSEKVGVAQQNLGAKSLAKMPIIIAPKEKQDIFSEFAKQVDKSKVAIQKSLAETQLLFDKLMQDYFG